MKKLSTLLILIIAFVILALLLVKQSKNTSSPQDASLNSEQVSSTKTSEPTILAGNLEVPWAIDFLPDGRLIFTERVGNVKIIDGKKIITVAKIDAKQIGEGGLMGVALHPDFATNHYIYFYYTYSSNGDDTLNRVERYKLENDKLIDKTTIIDSIPGNLFHDGGRIKFGPDKFLYVTTGDAQNPSLAQDKNSLAGKILRVKDDGKPAPENPFETRIYSYGHRNPQGIAWDKDGKLWETEHGPSGIWPNCCQDEINLIEKGQNYGWPDSVGEKVLPGTIGPVYESHGDTWAPSGSAVFNNSLLFAGLKGQSLFKFDLGKQNSPVKLLEGGFGRIRESIMGSDGYLYISTSNRDGRGIPNAGDDKIIRLDPNNL